MRRHHFEFPDEQEIPVSGQSAYIGQSVPGLHIFPVTKPFASIPNGSLFAYVVQAQVLAAEDPNMPGQPSTVGLGLAWTRKNAPQPSFTWPPGALVADGFPGWLEADAIATYAWTYPFSFMAVASGDITLQVVAGSATNDQAALVPGCKLKSIQVTLVRFD